VATAYALTAAPYLIVLFRILLRWLKHETFEPDDYLMLFGAVLYAVFTAAFVVAVSPSSLDECSCRVVRSIQADLHPGIPRHQHQPDISQGIEAQSSPIR
jgi:hypothetical protein